MFLLSLKKQTNTSPESHPQVVCVCQSEANKNIKPELLEQCCKVNNKQYVLNHLKQEANYNLTVSAFVFKKNRLQRQYLTL